MEPQGLHGKYADFKLIKQLCSYQALVKGEQSLVDLKDVIIPMLHEILHDDVKLVGVGKRKASLHEHILHFRKRQLKGNGKRNDRGLGRLIRLVRGIFEKSFRSINAIEWQLI